MGGQRLESSPVVWEKGSKRVRCENHRKPWSATDKKIVLAWKIKTRAQIL